MKILSLLTVSLLLIESINAQCTSITNKQHCKRGCIWVVSDRPTVRCIGASATNEQCKCISKQTPSPLVTTPCLYGNAFLDLIILVDASCPMTSTQCGQQQQHIIDTITSIKPIDTLNTGNQVFENMRIGYIEYGSIEANVIIDLEGSKFNPFVRIRDSSICNDNNISQRNGNPLLRDAIQKAIQLFKIDSNNLMRDKKLLIFSNCGVTTTEQTQICIDYENNLSNRKGFIGINVVMVNNKLDSSMIDPQTYIMCLVEYDPTRIFLAGDFSRDIVYDIHAQLCEHPTPAPTSDPTADPTAQQIQSTESTTQITTQQSITTTKMVTTSQAQTTIIPTVTTETLETTSIITTLTTTNPSMSPTELTTNKPSFSPMETTEILTTNKPSFPPTSQTTPSPTCPDYSNRTNPCNYFTFDCCPIDNGLCYWDTSNFVCKLITPPPTNQPSLPPTPSFATTSVITTNKPSLPPTPSLSLCCACMNTLTVFGCPQDKECEEIMCNDDPHCCNKEFDTVCVELATQICIHAQHTNTTATTSIETTSVITTNEPSLSPTLQPTLSPTCPDYSSHSNPCNFYTFDCCLIHSELCYWNISILCMDGGGPYCCEMITPQPTAQPTSSPTTIAPTTLPTQQPTIESHPLTVLPSLTTTTTNTIQTTIITEISTTNEPSKTPISDPTISPTIPVTTISPSPQPTDFPSLDPTSYPTTFTPTGPLTTTVNTTEFNTIDPTLSPSRINLTSEPSISSTTQQTTIITLTTIEPSNAPTTTANPSISPSVIPTISPTYKQWACTNNTCAENMDIYQFTIAVSFSFSSTVSYNLNNIECFLFKTFESMALGLDQLCIGLIKIKSINGGIEDQNLCSPGPCISNTLNSNALRRLLQSIDGSIIITITTIDSDICENINNATEGTVSEIENALRDNFPIELSTRLDTDCQTPSTTFTETVSNISSTEANEQTTTTHSTTESTTELTESSINTESVSLTTEETLMNTSTTEANIVSDKGRNIISTPIPAPDFVGLWVLLGIIISCLLFVLIIMLIRRTKYHQDVRSIYEPPIYHDEQQPTDAESRESETDNEQQILVQ